MNKVVNEKVNIGSIYLTIESKENYLQVELMVDNEEYETVLDSWAYIARVCKNNNYNKVLVKEISKNQVDNFEIYLFANKLPKLGFKDIKIAFYEESSDHHLKNYLAQITANKLGVNGKVFTNHVDAKNWLLS